MRRAKGGESRRLPLPRPTVEALRRYLLEGRSVLLGAKPDPGLLFLTRRGAPLGQANLRYRVVQIAARCGTKAFPHLFRRTLATELAEAGVALHSIQKVLGHAQISMTSEYVAVGIESMRAALEKFVGKRPAVALQVQVDLQSRLFNDWQAPAA